MLLLSPRHPRAARVSLSRVAPTLYAPLTMPPCAPPSELHTSHHRSRRSSALIVIKHGRRAIHSGAYEPLRTHLEARLQMPTRAFEPASLSVVDVTILADSEEHEVDAIATERR